MIQRRYNHRNAKCKKQSKEQVQEAKQNIIIISDVESDLETETCSLTDTLCKQLISSKITQMWDQSLVDESVKLMNNYMFKQKKLIFTFYTAVYDLIESSKVERYKNWYTTRNLADFKYF